MKINAHWTTDGIENEAVAHLVSKAAADNCVAVDLAAHVTETVRKDGEIAGLQLQVASLTSGARISDDILESLRPSRDAAMNGLRAEVDQLRHDMSGDPRAKFVTRDIAQGWCDSIRRGKAADLEALRRINTQRLADLAAVHEVEIARRDEQIADTKVRLENSRVSEESYQREASGWRVIAEEFRREADYHKANSDGSVFELVKRSLLTCGIEISGERTGRCTKVVTNGPLAARDEEIARLKYEIDDWESDIAEKDREIAMKDAEIERLAHLSQANETSIWRNIDAIRERDVTIAAQREMLGEANRKNGAEIIALKADAHQVRRALAQFGIKITGPGRSLSIDAGAYLDAQNQALKSQIARLTAEVERRASECGEKSVEVNALKAENDKLLRSSRVGAFEELKADMDAKYNKLSAEACETAERCGVLVNKLQTSEFQAKLLGDAIVDRVAEVAEKNNALAAGLIEVANLKSANDRGERAFVAQEILRDKLNRAEVLVDGCGNSLIANGSVYFVPAVVHEAILTILKSGKAA